MLLEMLRDEAVEKLPMKDTGLCFLICNSIDKRKVSSEERDRLYMHILRNAPKHATLHKLWWPYDDKDSRIKFLDKLIAKCHE